MNKNTIIAKQLLKIAKNIVAIQRKEQNKELFNQIYNAFDSLEDEVRKHGNDSTVKTFLTNLFGTKDFKIDDKNKFIHQLQDAIIGNHLEQADDKLIECRKKFNGIKEKMMEKYEEMKKEYERDSWYKKGDYYKDYKQKYENYKKDVNNYFSSRKEATAILGEAIKEINMLLNGSLKEIPDDAKKVLSKGIKSFKEAVINVRENIKEYYSKIFTEKDKSIKSLMKNIEENDLKEQEKEIAEKSEEENKESDLNHKLSLWYKKHSKNIIENLQSIMSNKEEQAEAQNQKFYDDLIDRVKKGGKYDKGFSEEEAKELKNFAKRIKDVQTKKLNELKEKVFNDIKEGNGVRKEVLKQFEEVFDKILSHEDEDIKNIEKDILNSNNSGKHWLLNNYNGILICVDAVNYYKEIGEMVQESYTYQKNKLIRKLKRQKMNTSQRIATAKQLIKLAKMLID